MHLEWLKDTAIALALDAAGPHMKDNEAWIRLALACLDQGGVSLSGQVRIARVVERELPARESEEQSR